MAVGVLKDRTNVERFYPITRWGEALLPAEAIKRYVRSVNRQARLIGIALALAACFAIASYFIAIHEVGFGWPMALTMFAVIITAVTLMVRGSNVNDELKATAAAMASDQTAEQVQN